MIDNKNAALIIGAMNLLTAGLPILANQTNPIAHKQMEQINLASVKSVESSWLKVPVSCKARGFHASPTPLDVKEMASQIKNIYSQYQA